MSIIYNNRDGYFIDHREYLSNVYKNVSVDKTEKVSYTISAKLFSIVDNKVVNNRKRTHNSENFHEESIKLKGFHERFIKELPLEIKENFIKKYKLLDTTDVRDLAQNYFESTIFNFEGLNGGNNSDSPLKCKIKEHDFLIPSHSRFYCGSIHEQCQKLEGNKFDIVIADPPWWNKYIRRLKSANDKLSGCKKQPYERVLIGKVGDVKDVPESQMIVSVPSALHSHKPPLLDILTPLVKTENPQVLELFARYLLPNTTSVGYEPLKWQHISLFEEVT